MADHKSTVVVQPIWYTWQRVLRTALTTALTLLPVIPQVVQIVQGQWDAQWLTAVSVQAVAINAALTKIIAIPTVNGWLTYIGLGSVPKSAATADSAPIEYPDVVAEDVPDGDALVAGDGLGSSDGRA